MSGDESIVRQILDEVAMINDSSLDGGSIITAIDHKLTKLIPLLHASGTVLNPPAEKYLPAA